MRRKKSTRWSFSDPKLHRDCRSPVENKKLQTFWRTSSTRPHSCRDKDTVSDQAFPIKNPLCDEHFLIIKKKTENLFWKKLSSSKIREDGKPLSDKAFLITYKKDGNPYQMKLFLSEITKTETPIRSSFSCQKLKRRKPPSDEVFPIKSCTEIVFFLLKTKKNRTFWWTF